MWEAVSRLAARYELIGHLMLPISGKPEIGA
jgi:hypothetical protein